jgi:Cu(I)/Ag(I) efflux system membrane fusion protein
MKNRRVAIAAGVVIAILLVVVHRPLINWFTGGSPSTGERSAAVTTSAGPFSLEISLAPDPPRDKANTAYVRVTADGKPVTGATVKITYDMPAMGAMPEMKGAADVREEGGGRYRGSFDLPMSGSWGIAIDVASAGRQGSARFSLTVGRRGITVARGTVATTPALPKLGKLALSPPALTAMQRGLDAYERVRQLLAKDRIEGIATYARELADALRAVAATPGVPTELEHAAHTADALADAKSLDDARRAFGDVSRFLIAIVAAEPRLQAGWHRFDCSMVQDSWLQPNTTVDNPYMGSKMATCGTPGSLELAEVSADTRAAAAVVIDDARRTALGIKTSKVETKPIKLAIRAVGRLTYDETRLQDITLKVKGWVARLDINATGQAVARGQRLLTLYSPELFAAQQEFLLALREAQTTPEHASLAAASAKKLRLLGLTDGQIEEIKKRGSPIEELPIASPASGYVIAKDVVAGAAVEPGQRLYRIAALDQIWVEAAIYESDLPYVQKGQAAHVTLPYAKDRDVTGKVAVVYPYLDPTSRTGKVRIELPNKDLAFKPDMYADVAIDVDVGPRLAVPVSAVVYTGTRRIVFVDAGGGQFQPTEVKLGARAGDLIEVASGLIAGQTVVTEGNFLIAAESRLRSSTFWEDAHD